MKNFIYDENDLSREGYPGWKIVPLHVNCFIVVDLGDDFYPYTMTKVYGIKHINSAWSNCLLSTIEQRLLSPFNNSHSFTLAIIEKVKEGHK